jgi:hypothetical protein
MVPPTLPLKNSEPLSPTSAAVMIAAEVGEARQRHSSAVEDCPQTSAHC